MRTILMVIGAIVVIGIIANLIFKNDERLSMIDSLFC